MKDVIIKLRTKQEYEGESCSLDKCPFFNGMQNSCKLSDEELFGKRKCTSPPSFCQIRKHGLVEVIAGGNCIVRIKMAN